MSPHPRFVLLLTGASLVLLSAACSPSQPPAPDPASAGTGSSTGSSPDTRATPSTSALPEPDCSYTPQGSAARPVTAPPQTGVPQSGTAAVVLTTTEGKVRITLDRDRAPCTVNSFLSLAKQGFYTDTRCHRLIDKGTGVLQCGDPTGTGSGGPGYVFPDELSGDESYDAGTVAMANAGPNTNGSQFFMTYQDFPVERAAYTVFGHLDEASRQVVARIGAEGQDGSYDDSGRPNNEAQISAVSVEAGG